MARSLRESIMSQSRIRCRSGSMEGGRGSGIQDLAPGPVALA